MGPPPPGATRGLGVTAMLLARLLYTPTTGGCQLSHPPVYCLKLVEGAFSEIQAVVSTHFPV
jgi:hypothetical protein